MFIKNLDYWLDHEECVIRFTESGKKKALKNFNDKKLTGTKFYALSNHNTRDAFNSKFEAFLSMVGFKIPIFDKKYVDAGTRFEQKIFSQLQTSLGEKYDMELIGMVEGYDYFPQIKNFGGIPDVIATDKATGEKVVFDIKTVKSQSLRYKISSNGFLTDEKYRFQVELYRELLGYDKSKIIFATLEYPYDHMDEQKKSFNLYIAEVSPLEDVRFALEETRSNILAFIESGVSPKYNYHDNIKTLILLNSDETIETAKRLTMLNEDIF